VAANALPNTGQPIAQFAERCRAIVGAEHVRPAGPGDAVGGVAAQLVVEPADEEEVATVLRCADDAGIAVAPRGGGTKLEWGNPPLRTDVILSLARLNRILEHAWADLTVTVQAGCPVAALQAALAQHRQRLAVDALWPERATVGGILATNDSGALRLRYGGLRDLIIGVTLALADGTLAASGGKVVKNVAGYDLPKLGTGALGTLGVVTQATFRLHPLPQHTRTLTISAEGIGAMQELVLAIQDSQLAHSALQVRTTGQTAPELDVLFEGTEAGLAAQEAGLRALVGSASVVAGSTGVWNARQALWSDAEQATASGEAVAKLSVLPADLATTMATIERVTNEHRARWRAVVQATGIGYLRVDAAPEALPLILQELRAALEAGGGSLVVLRQPPGESRVDAWGSPGDALPLMRALKQQFDPQGTLNPGRYVGGI
jgi:glycolate oxidase FAD binding subunit